MNLSEISSKIKYFLLPKYTEITLFLTSLSVFLIFIFVKEFREGAIDFLIKQGDPNMWVIAILVLAIILIGFLSSIYYSLTSNKVSNFFKDFMLIYMILINSFIGLFAWVFLTEKVNGINEIFPTVNILYAIFLLTILRMGVVISDDFILDTKAKRSEILIGSIVVIAIFIYSHFVLNNYWAITFSMCLAYATTFNEIINKILFPDKIVIIK